MGFGPNQGWEMGLLPRMLLIFGDYRNDNVVIILVGNKVDKKDRKVSRGEAEKYASELGVRYFETSAKTGENIEAVFEEVARQIYDTLDLSDLEMHVSSNWQEKDLIISPLHVIAGESKPDSSCFCNSSTF